MNEGIYLIPSSKDFLKVIDEMIALENERQSDFLHLHKHLTSSDEVKKEIRFINHCKINSFNGFKKNALIKVSLTSREGERIALTYSFNTSDSTPYRKLYRFFRAKRC